jgi:hypothetical protein
MQLQTDLVKIYSTMMASIYINMVMQNAILFYKHNA